MSTRRDHRSRRPPAAARALALVLAFWGATASAGEVDVETALATIEKGEGAFVTLRWNAEFRQGTMADIEKPEAAVFGDVKAAARVLSGPISGRYRVDLESVTRWVRGIDDHAAQRQSFAYDGFLEHRDLSFFKPGKTPPKPGEDAGRARVFHEGSADAKSQLSAGLVGLADMPPNFQGETLSSRLRFGLEKGRPATIDERGGLWRIDPQEPDYEDSAVIIDYDPAKHLVVAAVWQNGVPERPWRRYTVEPQELGKSRWVPRVVRAINLFDRTIDELRYTDVKPDETPAENDFRLDFPVGASVTDFTKKTSYTVGDTAPEAPESSRRFRVENP